MVRRNWMKFIDWSWAEMFSSLPDVSTFIWSFNEKFTNGSNKKYAVDSFNMVSGNTVDFSDLSTHMLDVYEEKERQFCQHIIDIYNELGGDGVYTGEINESDLGWYQEYAKMDSERYVIRPPKVKFEKRHVENLGDTLFLIQYNYFGNDGVRYMEILLETAEIVGCGYLDEKMQHALELRNSK